MGATTSARALPSVACCSASRCTPSTLLEVTTVPASKKWHASSAQTSSNAAARPTHFLLAAFELRSDRALRGLDRRRGNNQYCGHWHARLDRRGADCRNQGCDALRGMPSVVFVHGLEIVGAQHQDHQRQRRVGLDALGEANEAVSAGLEGIVPHGAAAVETVLDDANRSASGDEQILHQPRPALIERQTTAGGRDDAPGKGVGINQHVVHGPFV